MTTEPTSRTLAELIGDPNFDIYSTRPDDDSWDLEDHDRPFRTADEVIRFYAAVGLHYSAMSLDLLPALGEPNQLSEYRYRIAARETIFAHDVILLLKRLQAVAPGAADELASRIVLAAQAGDSYGEWLWQWADQAGLPADAICKNAELAAAEIIARDEKA